jgi:hypothetical protein
MLMFDLSPPVLYELGLVAAVEQLTAQIGKTRAETSWKIEASCCRWTAKPV